MKGPAAAPSLPAFSIFFKYFSCSPSLFLHFISLRPGHLSWSLNQVLPTSSLIFPAPGSLENTYITFVAEVPTGGKSADY